MLTFKKWIRRKEQENSNIGDLAWEIGHHSLFPNTYSLDETYNYMCEWGTDEEGVQTLLAAWNEYMKYVNQARFKEGETVSKRYELPKSLADDLRIMLREWNLDNEIDLIYYLLRAGVDEI